LCGAFFGGFKVIEAPSTETVHILRSCYLCIFPISSLLSTVREMTSASVNSRDLKASDWVNVKPVIARLYKVEKRPLRDVKREIEKTYGLVAK
jgi:hypothetical protein